jgi:aspartate/tyrosine/aromatic aminotransferase
VLGEFSMITLNLTIFCEESDSIRVINCHTNQKNYQKIIEYMENKELNSIIDICYIDNELRFKKDGKVYQVFKSYLNRFLNCGVVAHA